jgi:nitroreductase
MLCYVMSSSVLLILSQRSPSSFNLQPTHIILVQNQDLKDQLSEQVMLGPGNQFRTRDASAVAVFLSDLEPTKRIDRIYQLEKDHRNPNYLSSFPMVPSFLIGEGHAATFLKGVATSLLSEVQPMPVVEPVQSWSYKNASLVAQTFVYAAESHDLATCMMEGFDGRRVKEVLRVPDRYAIPLVVAMGYEYEDPETFQDTPRLTLKEVVFGETFGEALNLNEDSEPSKGEAA